MSRPIISNDAPIDVPVLMEAGPPVRTNEPLPTEIGDKVRFWVPFNKTDGLTGVIKAFAAKGYAHVIMDDGSSERYIPIKYLVKL
jgi:hypothetical protein